MPSPGESSLILGGFFSFRGSLSLPVVIRLAATATIIGDNIGFLVGRTGGRRLVLRVGRRIFITEARLTRAEQFFRKSGGRTILIARFFPLLRTLGGPVAGIAKMPWKTFLIYQSAGAALWASTFGTAGYLLGREFRSGRQALAFAESHFWIVPVVLAAVVAAYVLYKRWVSRTGLAH